MPFYRVWLEGEPESEGLDVRAYFDDAAEIAAERINDGSGGDWSFEPGRARIVNVRNLETRELSRWCVEVEMVANYMAFRVEDTNDVGSDQ